MLEIRSPLGEKGGGTKRFWIIKIGGVGGKVGGTKKEHLTS